MSTASSHLVFSTLIISNSDIIEAAANAAKTQSDGVNDETKTLITVLGEYEHCAQKWYLHAQPICTIAK